jgi:SPOR domain/Tetratricopeptide repeat
VSTAAVRQSAGRAVSLALVLLTAQPPHHLSAQVDSLRRAALNVAQTRPDSARAMLRRLLASLPPSDSLYPGVLLTAARLAADAPTVATYLQRVAIEYSRSVWADSALLLLTQLNFAQGDPAATVQATERLRRDYPDSPLRPRAAFWGARAYFDLKDDAHGCALLQDAISGAGTDIEFKNQVQFYASRCADRPAPPVAAAPPESVPGSPRPPAGSTFAVQVLAVKSAPQVDEMLSRLKVMGFDARVVRDTSGLFKVRVGRYATREEAQEMQRNLKTRLGGQPFVVQEP